MLSVISVLIVLYAPVTPVTVDELIEQDVSL